MVREVLQTIGLCSFIPMVTARPGCGRTISIALQELAQNIQNYLRNKMITWRDLYPGAESLDVAVMGYVVSGPDESELADIGISLPGIGETPIAPVYIDGERKVILKGDNMAAEFLVIIEDYVKTNYGEGGSKRNQNRITPIPTI